MLVRCRHLRHSARPQALRAASTALSNAPTTSISSSSPLLPHGVASRPLSTQRALSTYLLSRAKILQLVTRTLLAYPTLASLESTASPLGRRFAPGCSMRERMFMFICSLVPPDEPVDLPELLTGASHAAHTVFQQLYMAPNMATGNASSFKLSDVAMEECVALWRTKVDAQKKTLGLPVDAKLELTGLDVRDARLAELEYAYSQAGPEQHTDSQSVFQLNESLRATVRFNVAEYVRVSSVDDLDEEERGDVYVLDTAFDWTFESNVSRANLVDWYIADATPFVTRVATGEESEVVKEETGEASQA